VFPDPYLDFRGPLLSDEGEGGNEVRGQKGKAWRRTWKG